MVGIEVEVVSTVEVWVVGGIVVEMAQEEEVGLVTGIEVGGVRHRGSGVEEKKEGYGRGVAGVGRLRLGGSWWEVGTKAVGKDISL